MPKMDGPNQKPGTDVSSNAHISRLKSRSLVRSNSSASLREAQSAIKLKRSASVKKVTSSSETPEESKIFSIEGEMMFHDGLLALYQETMALNGASHLLQGQEEIMSQLLYLENKSIEKKKALVELTKKFTQLRHLVAIKETCDKLIPEYEDIISKLEAMSVSGNLQELFATLDLMVSQVQAVNLETLKTDDVNSYIELCKELEEDLNYLKQLRENQTEPLLEETNAIFEALNDKFERLESLQVEIKKLDQLLRIRGLEDSCITAGD